MNAYKIYYKIETSLMAAKKDLKLERVNLKRLLFLSSPKDVKSVDFAKISSSVQFIPDSEQIKQIAICQAKINILSEYIREAEKVKEDFVNGFNDIRKRFVILEYDIFYLHHIKRKSLNEVSQQLNYSYGYIKNINANITKQLNQKKIDKKEVS